jgi:hypothetical protein
MQNEISILADDGSSEIGDPLEVFAAGLSKTLTDVIAQRAEKEQEWLENLRQYRGVYPPDFVFPDGGSRVFTNITKPKTKNGAAQLIDMLFPVDDKNYSIQPTPKPEVLDALGNEEVAKDAAGNDLQFADTKEPYTKGDDAKATMERAQDAAEKMARTIDDQLVECDYNAEARRAIYSAAIFGTGVMCGPEVEQQEVRSYVKNPQTGAHELTLSPDKRPVYRFVPLWDFFPDMSAATINECNYVFERTYMSKKTLKDMRRIQNIHQGNLKKLLNGDVDAKSTQHFSSHVSELRQLSGIISMIEDTRFEVWRYRGPIKSDVLVSQGVLEAEQATENEYDGIVIFCGGLILKASVNPMETEDWPYSVFCWDYDDNCIFGTGIPHDARQQQAVVNTAMRLMLDNATKSAGPQIVINKSLKPSNGDYSIGPWKIWETTDEMLDVDKAFKTFGFQSHQQELANIYQLAKAQIDEETGLPMIQQGDQGQVTPTLGGMSMLMNASNTVRRSQVKQWDDYMTVPNITRLYDWNMQFNPDETIKGDLKVYARGTSSLLVKEQQAQAMLTALDKYAGHPVLSKFLKNEGLDAMRRAFQSMHIDPDEALKTIDEYQEELKAQQEAMQQQGEPEDPRLAAEKLRGENRMAEIKAEHEMRQQENELSYAIAQMRRDAEIAKLTQTERIKYEELAAKALDRDKDRDLDASKFKTELQVKQVMGETANFGLDN